MQNIKELNTQMQSYIGSVADELEQLIEDICKIPAPSDHEQLRAQFCKEWFEKNGCKVYVDEVLNVICPVGDDGKCDLTLFTAHTDTVFPDMTTMPFSKDETTIYSPSCGDDTACLAIMMLCARYVLQNGLKPNCGGIIFAANSCEEGFGNLKGIRKIMETYGGRIKRMYSFDSKYSSVVNRCVGSHRYNIEVKTRGGHSFSNFGNDNAIHIAAQIISKLYTVNVPYNGNSVTTYNVGLIEGGTSVNTIAQSCSFKYEYRSDCEECLAQMKNTFEEIIAEYAEKYTIEVTLMGERPCMSGVDIALLDEMANACKAIQERYSKTECALTSGSTDCNIPLSMGIPAVTAGVFDGGGEHTREEYIYRSSLPIGMQIAMTLICSYFD